ncbi:hypothetical protein DERP_010418 [Dermatophagoides pteronyssinus]|uniref:Uncharacterized protein n=1 Tax=Dermatophagoides pteronyssinus TaxID=6956 RepID=A0ABQ8J4V1_DERPT|nr:hypothetical protein DERP_010418 [Dermatophagoides pteronyssinus]
MNIINTDKNNGANTGLSGLKFLFLSILTPAFSNGVCRPNKIIDVWYRIELNNVINVNIDNNVRNSIETIVPTYIR